MGETRDKNVSKRIYNEPTGNINDLVVITNSIEKFAKKVDIGDYSSEKQRLHYLNLIYRQELKRKKYMQMLGLLPVRKKSN